MQLVDPQKDPPPYPLSQQQPGAAQPLPLELEMHADLRASWDAYHKLPASNSLTVSFQALQSGITVAVVSGRHAGRIFFFLFTKSLYKQRHALLLRWLHSPSNQFPVLFPW